MENDLPSSSKLADNRKDLIKKFENLIVEALRFADESDLDWSTTLAVSIYETSEYACFKARGSLPLVAHALFNSIGASIVRRVDADEIFQDFDKDEIIVSIKSKLRTEKEKNDVIMMLVAAISEISSDLSNFKTPDHKTLH